MPIHAQSIKVNVPTRTKSGKPVRLSLFWDAPNHDAGIEVQARFNHGRMNHESRAAVLDWEYVAELVDGYNPHDSDDAYRSFPMTFGKEDVAEHVVVPLKPLAALLAAVQLA